MDLRIENTEDAKYRNVENSNKLSDDAMEVDCFAKSNHSSVATPELMDLDKPIKTKSNSDLKNNQCLKKDEAVEKEGENRKTTEILDDGEPSPLTDRVDIDRSAAIPSPANIKALQPVDKADNDEHLNINSDGLPSVVGNELSPDLHLLDKVKEDGDSMSTENEVLLEKDGFDHKSSVKNKNSRDNFFEVDGSIVEISDIKEDASRIIEGISGDKKPLQCNTATKNFQAEDESKRNEDASSHRENSFEDDEGSTVVEVSEALSSVEGISSNKALLQFNTAAIYSQGDDRSKVKEKEDTNLHKNSSGVTTTDIKSTTTKRNRLEGIMNFIGGVKSNSRGESTNSLDDVNKAGALISSKNAVTHTKGGLEDNVTIVDRKSQRREHLDEILDVKHFREDTEDEVEHHSIEESGGETHLNHPISHRSTNNAGKRVLSNTQAADEKESPQREQEDNISQRHRYSSDNNTNNNNNNNKRLRPSSIFMDEINKLLDTDDDVIIELEFYEDVVVSSRENTRDYNGEHNIGNTNDRNDMAAADNQLDRESTNVGISKSPSSHSTGLTFQQQQPISTFQQVYHHPHPPVYNDHQHTSAASSNAYVPLMPPQYHIPPGARGAVLPIMTTTIYPDGREVHSHHLESGLIESEKRFVCGVCGKIFNQSGSARTHMRLHTGTKPYKCDICGKGFNQSGNLRNHRRVHTGEKPYKCKYCGKGFSQVGNRQHHQRTHTGEKPYKCSMCGRGFNQSSDLQKHYRTHTGEKPYKCNVCRKAFNSSSNLQRHLRTHTAFQA